MRSKVNRTLKSIVGNPYINIVVGLTFMASGMSEAYAEISEGAEFQLGVHHGAILVGFWTTLRTLTEVIEGMGFVDLAGEELEDTD